MKDASGILCLVLFNGKTIMGVINVKDIGGNPHFCDTKIDISDFRESD